MDYKDIGPQILQTEIDGAKATCIVLSEASTHLPGYLLHGQSQTSYAYQDGKLCAIAWDGIAIVDGKQCLRFPPLKLYRAWEIASSNKGEALAFVKDLIQLLMKMDASFLALESGTIPLWRMYGLEGGGVFLLPPPLSSAIEACLGKEEREASFNAWVHYDLHRPYTLIDQMAQMLYYAATGTIPLASEEAREDHCNILPLRLLGTNLDPRLVELIDNILHAKLTQQRDLTGNQKPQEALSWLEEELSGFSWPSEAKANPDEKAVSRFLAKQHKRASRRRFWRKKGWIITTITLVVLALGYFTGGRIKEAMTPPYTYGMDDEQIIREYYMGQSELDVQKLEASLGKHAKSPAQMEVMNLFVNRQTRMAYENITSILNVNDWIAEGKPAIGYSQGVYGVTDVTIEKTGKDTYLARSTIYSPFAYDEDDTDKPSENHTLAFVYRQTQRFSFTTNKKGWRLIEEIANVEYHKSGVIEIETKPDKPSQAAQAVNAAYSLATPPN